jgi:hypothetical protein
MIGLRDRVEELPRKREKRRSLKRAAALAVSVALHLGILILIFGHASGAVVSAGAADDGPAIEVSLVSWPPPQASAPDETLMSGRLAVLAAKAQTEQAPVFEESPRAQSDLDTLAERLASAASPPAPAKVPEKRGAQIPSPGAESTPETSKTAAEGQPGRAGAAGSGASTGGLWGAMEPCFRKLGMHAAVAVTLEVAIDARGQLSKPPVILRGAGTPDEQRLNAESNALSALASCLPRGDLRFSDHVYRVEFRPG